MNTRRSGANEFAAPLRRGSAERAVCGSHSIAHRAFTLIELLVVIAIISILAAILFPVFAMAKESAKSTVEVSNARQIAMSVKMYQTDYDDNMPIFYMYNSIPPAGQPGHKGVEVELLPYCKDKNVFGSPLDRGSPFTDTDVPGAQSYLQAYGSSFRFDQCMYTIAANESSQNNVLYTFDRPAIETMFEFPAETRVMRAEEFPFFSQRLDPGCAKYGYDCPAPNNYYRQWGSRGGSVIFMDAHAKYITGSGQFDNERVDAAGDRSNDPNGSSWSGTWYGICD